MLTSREIRLARDVVEELRARGAEEKAAAIERAVATATAPISRLKTPEPREYFTIGQAARALSVGVRAIRAWMNAGDLRTVGRGDRVMIPRDALLSFLDQLQRRQPVGAERPISSQEGAARRAFVLAGLPPEKVERVHLLTEKIEASQSLTPAEEDELEHLEDEFARVSWERLKLWVEQQAART